MYEASLWIRGGSIYAVTTADSAADIKLWYNEYCDVLHVGDEAGGDVLNCVHDTIDMAASVKCGDELVIVTADCLRDYGIDRIEDYVRKHNLLLVPLPRHRDGAKVCCLPVISADNLTACFRDLVDSGFDVNAGSKRAMLFTSGSGSFLAPADTMPALTGRQREASQLTYAGGCYDLPCGIETAIIANEMGVSRRTAEEHLHRME